VLSFAEILLPAALVIGFATRLSALGLLILTGIIFAANYSGILFPGYQDGALTPDFWQTQTLPWGAMALALIAYGAGLFSFDRLIRESLRGG
jgi:putative oxidoreductase